MTSTASQRLRLDKQATGDNPDAWGDRLNAVIDGLDEAFGFVEIAVNGNVTLSAQNFVSDQSRRMVLRFTGAGGFAVTIPAVEKGYLIDCRCAADVILKTAATAGGTVPKNTIRWAYCDGATVVTDDSSSPTGQTTAFNPYRMVTSTTVQGAIEDLADLAVVPPSPFRNVIINGDFSQWQRGFSFANPASGSAVADMWRIYSDSVGGSFTVSLLELPDGLRKLRWAQTTAVTSQGTYREFLHAVEGADTLAGKRAILSFTPSTTGATVSCRVEIGQSFGTGGSPSAFVLAKTFSFTATSAGGRVVVPFDMPSVAAKTFGTNRDSAVTIAFFIQSGGVFTLDMGEVQLEAARSGYGDEPTPFEVLPGPIQLMRCERHFVKSYNSEDAPGTITTSGALSRVTDTATTGTISVGHVRLAAMRAVPTVTLYSPTTGSTTNPIRDGNAGPTDFPGGVVAPGKRGFGVSVTGTIAANHNLTTHFTADATLP